MPSKVDAVSHSATILVLPDSSMISLSSVIDPLRAANRLSRLPLFDWKIVSIDGNPISLSCGIEIAVEGKLTDDDKGALLAVVAGFNNVQHAPASKLANLRKIAPGFTTILGVEAGTWILARAGIIRHHSVTTHWEDTENLMLAYPTLDVRDQRYVVDNNIWTCGGASPALDMMLHYLRISQNRSLALDVASVFIYEESRSSSTAQSTVSLGRIESIEPRLAAAVRAMEANIEDPIPMRTLAKKIKISVRSLELLAQKYLGSTPGAYYLRLRLQAARKLVLDTNTPLLEISVRTGFNSQSAFSRAFKARYAQSPLALRNASI